MCKCSFVLVACLAVACLAAATSAQEYSVDQPTVGDDVALSKYMITTQRLSLLGETGRGVLVMGGEGVVLEGTVTNGILWYGLSVVNSGK